MAIIDVPTKASRNLMPQLTGWRLTWVLVLAIAVFATTVAVAAGGVAGANEGIRITARTSAVLFLLAFTASAAYRLWPNDATKWVRRNRRYLGVAFAGSHLVHAGFIVASVVLSSARFKAGVERTPHAVYVLDTIAYGFILAMAITSFDRIAKQMQYATWRRLHVIGSYVIWLTFFVAYWRRGITYPLFYGPFLLIILAALVIRSVGKVKRKHAAADD
ncbi:hypothetical protein [Mycolicibacterium sp. CBMA 234]|uniref:hypothetical protein n=1 Tax=Mycolicibacterium sp. CBMA 234 TaxID=1918495 RepID=UPI0012DD8460|nr:hypothetical protein [Mycolicibacterium sp. CBMA 234]